MRYRLLVVDVDGTLVGSDGEIAPGAAAAVARARAAGLPVALSTGRTPPACTGFLTELALTGPHIFFDGGLVLDPAADEPVLERRAAPEAVAELLDFARRQDLAVELYTRTGYYVGAITPEVEAHAALQRWQPVVADLDRVLAGGQVIKAELVLSRPEAVAAVRAFEPRLAGRLRLSWATAPGLPGISFVNVVNPYVSKGHAVATLAEYFGIPPAAVVAVGDSANDLPMFTVAGLAVAMANAPAAVREAAHLVTGRVDEGGLAHLIDHYLLADPSEQDQSTLASGI